LQSEAKKKILQHSTRYKLTAPVQPVQTLSNWKWFEEINFMKYPVDLIFEIKATDQVTHFCMWLCILGHKALFNKRAERRIKTKQVVCSPVAIFLHSSFSRCMVNIKNFFFSNLVLHANLISHNK
jgi:hypothetical protein